MSPRRSRPVLQVRLGALAVLLSLGSGCRAILGIEETTVEPGGCELLTQRVFFADKPVTDVEVTVGALTEARFIELAEAIGVTLDPDRGHGLAEIVDCEGEAAEFAAVDFEPSGAEAANFVTSGNRLVLGNDTGVEGVLGRLNLDVGEFEVTAYPDEIDGVSSQSDVVTRPGELSRIRLFPNSEVNELMQPQSTATEWMCVGAVEEPTVSDATVTITVTVQESRTFVPGGIPVQGARVAVCLDDAAACEADAPTPAGESAITDAAGRAEIIVSTGKTGFDGHLIVTGAAPGCEAR